MDLVTILSLVAVVAVALISLMNGGSGNENVMNERLARRADRIAEERRGQLAVADGATSGPSTFPTTNPAHIDPATRPEAA